MKEKDIRCWLAIGGLLHDVGKLIDRAEEVRAEDEKKAEFGYAHAYYSHSFIEEKLLEKSDLSEEVKEIILSGAYHHKPKQDNIYHRIHQLADWGASSERSRREDLQGERTEKRLKSVFSLVGLEGECKRGAEGFYEHRLSTLELERDVIFPVEAGGGKKEAREEYRELLRDLRESLKSIDFSQCHKALLKLYYILYKYLWCVPASTYDREKGTAHFPDISLFDHLRVVGALASSLWTEYNKKKLHQGLDGVEFLLVEGDITGIQKFLYQLSNTKGVGKRLRGRSFFLSVLPIILGRFFLKELGYPLVNLLYAGGGKFQMVIGYEEGIEEELERLQRRVDQVLLEEFGGQLGMVLGWLKLKGSELGVKTLGEKIQELYDEIGRRKFRKFVGVLDRFDELTKPGFPGNFEVCPSCMVNLKLEEEEQCHWCSVFQEVGARIPKADYLVFSDEDGDIYIPSIGGVYVVREEEGIPEGDVFVINHTDFEKEADGFIFLANTVPMEEEEVIDFERLVEEEELGYQLLAFVKADVDNLGLIFSQGLKEDYSLSRVATLSRSLDLFFSGYINKVLEKPEFYKKVYVVYSGGDDLFLCAPWETAISLARELEREFSEYTCYNPCFTISAGVFLQKPNYPIRFAADGAEEEKEVAKAEKNSISIWKTSLKWEKFNELLEDLKNFFSRFDPSEHRTLIYRIYQLLKAHKKNGKFNMRFYPLFYYQIFRNLSKEEEQRALEELILDKSRDYNLKKYAELSLRFILMKTRRVSGSAKSGGYNKAKGGMR